MYVFISGADRCSAHKLVMLNVNDSCSNFNEIVWSMYCRLLYSR